MRIAVIGAGVAGLSAAWLLGSRHDVTLFEKDARLGGHANTVTVETSDGEIPVDTGFIVYNTPSYPNLVALFDHLGVETETSSMTFAVSARGGAYEYSGSAIGLFGQPGNLLRSDHWRLVVDLFRFFRVARALSETGQSDNAETLGAWLAREKFSDAFVRDHIAPMGAAIWSTPAAEMLAFPAVSFARFFANHGLLNPVGRSHWRTVTGGSRRYVELLEAAFSGRTIAGDPVVEVLRGPNGVMVRTENGQQLSFDHCVIATHGDDALGLLGDADGLERTLLSPMRTSPNLAVLHRDPSLMPRRRQLWSSWNYMTGADETGLCVTYWMNSLQHLATRDDLFVTLNPIQPIDGRHVIAKFAYAHPLYDQAALDAQRRLWSLQGRRRTWFCGSYFGYGFHEDALQSGLAVAEELGGVRRPWTVANQSDRLTFVPRASVTDVLEAAE